MKAVPMALSSCVASRTEMVLMKAALKELLLNVAYQTVMALSLAELKV